MHAHLPIIILGNTINTVHTTFHRTIENSQVNSHQLYLIQEYDTGDIMYSSGINNIIDNQILKSGFDQNPHFPEA